MSQQAVNTIEQRFSELHKKTSPEVWNNADELFKLSQQLEKTDIYLARRVMQRVRTLQPDRPKIKIHLKRLSDEVALHAKQTQTSTSTEPSTKQSENKKNSEVKNNKLDNFFSKLNNNFSSKKWAQPWVLLLAVPFVLFAFYQLVWAAPRFESRAQLIIQQPDGMATMDPSMALLSGLGVGGNSTADTEIAKAYIHSEDMLNYLQTHNNLKEHYQNGGDVFSRLSSDASIEDLLKFYIDHTTVEIDEASGVIKILVQGFTPEFANTLTQAIVNRAEWYINSIGHQLADAQLQFIRLEHAKVEQRLRDAQKKHSRFSAKK